MPDTQKLPLDIQLERLSKLAGILVPIVLATAGWRYNTIKERNDDEQRKLDVARDNNQRDAQRTRDQAQHAFDNTQKQYSNLTSLVPLLTSANKAQVNLGLQLYLSEANANQAPTDLQSYIQQLGNTVPEDAALVQRAAAAGAQQQAQQCKANPAGLYLQVANTPEQLALGKALASRLRGTAMQAPVQGVQRIDKGPEQTQIRYYASAANDQELVSIRSALESVGVHVAQNVNLSAGYLKQGCTPPAVFELWIGTNAPLA